MEKAYGLKLNPHGLLANHRAIYKPMSHTIRDWMHMVVSSGVANVQLARVLCALMSVGITLDMVGDFVESVQLPHRHGKTSRSWVSKKRLGKARDMLQSFSGVMLSLIPILTTYVSQLIGDGHPLQG